MLQPVHAALETALPDGVRYALTDPTAAPTGLFEDEARAVGRAVEKRKREFAAGRRAARQALGRPDAVLPVGPNRAPTWPDGWTGSLSHSSRCCVAVACKTSDYAALGIDIENAESLDAAIAAEVMTRHESSVLGLSEAAVVQALSIKEAAFKLLCGKTEELLEFNDLIVKSHVDNLYRVTLERDLELWPRGTDLNVWSAQVSEFILSFTFIR